MSCNKLPRSATGSRCAELSSPVEGTTDPKGRACHCTVGSGVKCNELVHPPQKRSECIANYSNYGSFVTSYEDPDEDPDGNWVEEDWVEDWEEYVVDVSGDYNDYAPPYHDD